MKSLIPVLAVLVIALAVSESYAGGSFFSFSVGNGRNNFRQREAFRQGFRAGQRQQFRAQQFRGHGNQFRLNLNDHCN